MNNFKIQIDVKEIPSREVLLEERHFLTAEADSLKKNIYLTFSTRNALFDFAKSLLHEAVCGESGQQEFYPLSEKGIALVVDGVRLTEESSRIFVFYPKIKEAALSSWIDD